MNPLAKDTVVYVKRDAGNDWLFRCCDENGLLKPSGYFAFIEKYSFIKKRYALKPIWWKLIVYEKRPDKDFVLFNHPFASAPKMLPEHSVLIIDELLVEN
mgnify:CR=1